jgi:large subunit ribosomal protein L22
MATQTAELRFLRMAPRKVRLVADTLKGLSVSDAEAQLMLQPRRPAKPLLKLLRSAVANATNNQKLDAQKLMVKSIRVDQGPMLKRILPRARGSASPIQKKMSHVFLILEESPKALKRFTIVVPKKVKSEAGNRTRRAARDEKRDELVPRKADEKRGIFKRLFQRKSI